MQQLVVSWGQLQTYIFLFLDLYVRADRLCTSRFIRRPYMFAHIQNDSIIMAALKKRAIQLRAARAAKSVCPHVEGLPVNVVYIADISL